MQPQARLATVQDADMITVFVNAAYRGESARRGWIHEADLIGGLRTIPEDIRAIVKDNQFQVILLFFDPSKLTKLLATVHIQRRGSIGFIGMVAVDPILQAAGIGREVLRVAEDYAIKQWGVTTLQMTVLEKLGPLIAWYGRRGFQPSGERIPFKARFGIPKVDNMHFLVLTKSLTSKL